MGIARWCSACVWARERYVKSVTWWHYWCAGLQSMLTEEDEWLSILIGQ